jgi:tripartite-type tricarboxylate transporter receptor subunit TctC
MRPLGSLLVLCAAAVAVSTGGAYAQSDYPGKPIRMVLGFPPGGISDVLARAIGAKMYSAMGQQVLVDNRAGAGTTIASDIVAKAPPDGYTLFMQDITTHAINASLYRKLPYDSIRDFTPVALVATTPLMLLVHPSLPARSLKELIALAKSKPGQIVYASSGNGTILHLSMERLKSMAGIDMVHVPYKGSAPAVQALLGGEVAVSFSTMPPALPNVKAGKLRALGVTTARRVAAAPAVPTLNEAGLKDYEMVLYSGVIGPAGLPRDIVGKLNAELAKIVNSADFRQTLSTIGADPVTATPEQFAAHLRSDIDKLGAIVRAVGAHVD